MVRHTHGLVPVAAAFVGNVLVTGIKTAVALSSGSSAMFSEAVHSFADTINQALLLFGVRRSRKKPDEEYEYGYGSERFFWAIISACGIFFIGAGITIYHGIHAILVPGEVAIHMQTFVVLGASFAIESLTLLIALREVARTFPQHTWKERISETDPSTLAVLLEDSVAVAGVVIAAVAIGIAYATGNTLWDGIGSIVIGAALAVVAVTLIRKNRAYLIGRTIPEEEKESILALLSAEPSIERIVDFKSEVLDIGVYRIKCDIEFNGSSLLDEAYQKEQLLSQFDEVKDDFEEFKRFCADYADRIPRLMGKKIDEIEHMIRAQHPQVHYIDIEIN